MGVCHLSECNQPEGRIQDETTPRSQDYPKIGMVHGSSPSGSVWSEPSLFAGPVEVDETYMGGKHKNMPKAKRKAMTGRGGVGKTTIVGAKDRGTKKVRAEIVESTDRKTLHRFVEGVTVSSAKVYTDEALAYNGMARQHDAVRHSASEYVRGHAHTNGIESFWAMLKRAHKSIFHHFSAKHLRRYVNEFAGRHNIRDADTIDQMNDIVAGMVGKRLMYFDLISELAQ